MPFIAVENEREFERGWQIIKQCLWLTKGFSSFWVRHVWLSGLWTSTSNELIAECPLSTFYSSVWFPSAVFSVACQHTQQYFMIGFLSCTMLLALQMHVFMRPLFAESPASFVLVWFSFSFVFSGLWRHLLNDILNKLHKLQSFIPLSVRTSFYTEERFRTFAKHPAIWPTSSTGGRDCETHSLTYSSSTPKLEALCHNNQATYRLGKMAPGICRLLCDSRMLIVWRKEAIVRRVIISEISLSRTPLVCPTFSRSFVYSFYVESPAWAVESECLRQVSNRDQSKSCAA